MARRRRPGSSSAPSSCPRAPMIGSGPLATLRAQIAAPPTAATSSSAIEPSSAGTSHGAMSRSLSASERAIGLAERERRTPARASRISKWGLVGAARPVGRRVARSSGAAAFDGTPPEPTRCVALLPERASGTAAVESTERDSAGPASLRDLAEPRRDFGSGAPDASTRRPARDARSTSSAASAGSASAVGGLDGSGAAVGGCGSGAGGAAGCAPARGGAADAGGGGVDAGGAAGAGGGLGALRGGSSPSGST
jgi:hypothetical protein